MRLRFRRRPTEQVVDVEGSVQEVLQWQAGQQLLQQAAQLFGGTGASPMAIDAGAPARSIMDCDAVLYGGPAGVQVSTMWCPHRDRYEEFPIEHGPPCGPCATRLRNPVDLARLRDNSWREQGCRRCDPRAVARR